LSHIRNDCRLPFVSWAWPGGQEQTEDDTSPIKYRFCSFRTFVELPETKGA